MQLFSLFFVQLIVLVSWFLLGTFDSIKEIIQLTGLLQCLVYANIFVRLFKSRGFYYCLPWFFVSSIWFIYSDIVLGNFVANEQYVAKVCLYVSAFVLLTTFFYKINPLISWKNFNKSNPTFRYSIVSYRLIFFFVPLVVQFLLANGSIEMQFEMLFGGRASGITFWGNVIPHQIRTFLSPLNYIFNMSASLFVAKILQKRTLLSLINIIPSLIVLVSAFASGGRNLFLMAFIPFLWICFIYLKSLKFKILFITIIVIFLPQLMQYQVSNRGLFDFQAGEFRNKSEVIGGSNFISMHRDNNIDIFASAVKSRETNFLNSTNYTSIIVSSMQILPRAIFTFKPKNDEFDYETGTPGFDPGYLSLFAFESNVTSSLSLTLPGDFYYADSLRGLFLGSVLTSILLKIADWMTLCFRRNFDRDSGVILQSFVVFVSLFSFRSYGGNFVFGVPLLLVYFSIIFLDKLRQFAFGKVLRTEL